MIKTSYNWIFHEIKLPNYVIKDIKIPSSRGGFFNAMAARKHWDKILKNEVKYTPVETLTANLSPTELTASDSVVRELRENGILRELYKNNKNKRPEFCL